jgi:hypothetical protein
MTLFEVVVSATVLFEALSIGAWLRGLAMDRFRER